VLSACELLTAPAVGDVRVLSVEVVDSRDEAAFRDTSVPAQKLLKVNFASKESFRTLSRKFEYSLAKVSSICTPDKSVDDSKRLRAFPYIYDSSGVIEPYNSSEDGASTQNLNSKQLISYYFYLRPAGPSGYEVLSGDASQQFAYDLKSNPEDICFRVGGRRMIGSDLDSNTAVIPREVVARALSKAGLK
jgi:hypothetical protein